MGLLKRARVYFCDNYFWFVLGFIISIVPILLITKQIA